MASESTSTRHPFAAELIARAAKIGAKLRAQQDQSDSSGRYSDEIHRELLEGGFYRVLQPRMFKGGGVDCETYIRVILGCRPASAMCDHTDVAGAAAVRCRSAAAVSRGCHAVGGTLSCRAGVRVLCAVERPDKIKNRLGNQ